MTVITEGKKKKQDKGEEEINRITGNEGNRKNEREREN